MDTLLYDDFSGTSVDTSKWTIEGSTTVSGGVLTQTGAGGPATTIKSILTFVNNVTAEWVGTCPRTTASQIDLGFSGAKQLGFGNAWNVGANIYIRIDNASVYDTGVACSTSTMHTFKVERLANGTTKFYIDGALKYTDTNVVTTALQFGSFNLYDSGLTVKFDSVLIQAPSTAKAGLLLALV